MKQIKLPKIFWGYDFFRDLDFQIFIGWDEKENQVVGEIRFNKYLEFFWNWKPTFVWLITSDSPFCNRIDSSKWTGRNVELLRWYWPMGFRFYNGRLPKGQKVER